MLEWKIVTEELKSERISPDNRWRWTLYFPDPGLGAKAASSGWGRDEREARRRAAAEYLVLS